MADSGRYDALHPRAPSPYQFESTNLEDLDFDRPPGAAHPMQMYNNEFGGPQPRQSYASSLDAPSLSRPPSSGGLTPDNTVRGASNARFAPSPLQHGYRDDPSEYAASNVAMAPMPNRSMGGEKQAMYASPAKRQRRRFWLIGGIILAAVLIIAAVIIGVLVAKNHNKNNSDSGSSSTGSGSSKGKPKTQAAISGGAGSTITFNNGSGSLQYQNNLGGFWYYDAENPLVSNAAPNSWTPPLNETFPWGDVQIYGVNLGGWLVTEPFIVPSLYQKYPGTVDEWTLSEAMAADKGSGGLNQMEDHYKTFVTEEDFANIASAGLNFVRIPIGYWAIETRGDEPFLAKTSWTYFLKAIEWARKYGLRINLDFHSLPGSQNGWNHSGRLGTINVLNGVMGLANAQRSLSYVRILAEFVSQPQYSSVVQMFGVTNEPQASTMGQDVLSAYYLEAYNVVRKASGTGQGNGPMISYHDGFASPAKWAGFLPNADRISLDTHPYFAFGDNPSAAEPGTFAPNACNYWAGMMNDSMGAFGLTVAGEFSLATNDCGTYVNGVGLGTRFEGTYRDPSDPGAPTTATGSCDGWLNYQSWTQDRKDGYKQMALGSMDALHNWFFWTWKIGPASSGNIEAPQWSYSLGLSEGWISQDPRDAAGHCAPKDPWQGPLAAWQTGGQGAGAIAADVTNALPWPPASIANGGVATALPQYQPTGSVITLPVPTFTSASSASVGSGWANSGDSDGIFVAAPGCNYPEPWSGVGAAVPTQAACTAGAGSRRSVPEPRMTQMA